MNVTFICRTLEAGQCGVGDYTRKLAAALIRQGHPVSVIALRDNYVTDIVEELLMDRTAQIPVLRFPMVTKWSLQAKRIQSFLDRQGTQWLSLQYVPYSIQGKGLHWARNTFFKEIGKGRHWHIMFHELWLGLGEGTSLKRYWWGRAQRLCLLNLVKKLKPACVHTHSRVYQAALLKNGITSQQLPLFSNIDPIPDHSPHDRPSGALTFALFASIRKSSAQESFLKELETYNLEKGHTSRILFLGRNGALKEQWKQAINEKQTITYEDLGTLEAEAISRHLSKADIALSFTPLLLTEKSGTVACYWAHDLPVLSLADDWRMRGNPLLENPEGVVGYQEGCLQAFLDTSRTTAGHYRNADQIAAQFAEQTARPAESVPVSSTTQSSSNQKLFL